MSEVSRRVRGLRLRRAVQVLTISSLAILPSVIAEWRRRPDCKFSKLDTQPIFSPVYASLDTLQRPVQNSGPSGLLVLSREALSSSTPCRFIPAHHHIFGSCPKSVIAHKRFCSKELWSGGLRSCSRKIGKRAVPEHRELCELSVAGRVAVRAVFNRWVTGGSSGRSCHPAAECPNPSQKEGKTTRSSFRSAAGANTGPQRRSRKPHGLATARIYRGSGAITLFG